MRLPIHSPAHSLLTGLALLITLAYGVSAFAQEPPFLVLPGLESSVDFWKQIFTRYGFADAVLFDPIDPSTVYRVLRVPENEQGRATVDRERARVVADYDLIDDETRIRSQRGAKEHFAEGLRISGRYMAQMQKIFRDEGLPVELAYLPLVESSFNIRARSGVGAVGMCSLCRKRGRSSCASTLPWTNGAIRWHRPGRRRACSKRTIVSSAIGHWPSRPTIMGRTASFAASRPLNPTIWWTSSSVISRRRLVLPRRISMPNFSRWSIS